MWKLKASSLDEGLGYRTRQLKVEKMQNKEMGMLRSGRKKIFLFFFLFMDYNFMFQTTLYFLFDPVI